MRTRQERVRFSRCDNLSWRYKFGKTPMEIVQEYIVSLYLRNIVNFASKNLPNFSLIAHFIFYIGRKQFGWIDQIFC